MSALIGGLMYLCIMNYSDFSKAITNGMAEYAGLLNRGATDTLDPLRKGWEIFNHIIHSDVSMIDTFIFFLCGIVILICFTLITIQIIYIKCEASVAIGAGFLLLGFGCSRLFRDYVMNLLRYIICVGFKLFVLHAVLGLGFGFIKDKFILTGALSLEGMGIMIVVSILLLALTKSLPDVAAGIIQGAHVNTGGNLTSTIHQVAHLAAGAAAATAMTARNTPGFVKNVKTAADIARAGGASGAGRVAAQTVRNLAAAREMMMMDSPNAGVNRKMRSKLELMRPPAPPAASSSSEPAQTPKGQGGEA
jgi:type IV secretion system protein TrbL